MAYESRDEIDERYRWDLSSIYADDEAFLGALDKAREYPEILAAYRGKISTSAEDLLACLRASDEVGVELGKLVNYAQRKLDEDTRNATYQDYSAQVISVYTEVSSATSWFAPEILKLDDEQIERFYVSCPDLDL